MTFETFTTTIAHPFTEEPLSVEVCYRMADIGHMMILNEDVQPIIDSVVGDSREWIVEIDDEVMEILVHKAFRHDQALREMREDMFKPRDYGE